MSVNSYLSDLASNLVLNSTEKSNVSTSIESIKLKLGIYFGSEVKEKVLFGSYTRETILPKKADNNSDVDLMVIFDNSNGYKPQTFLNKLKGFSEYYYSRSEIYQSSPTIVLELNHIKFELVPAYCIYGMYYIPDKFGGWMYTNPNGFNTELTKCNASNGFKIKPVVRLVKHWNIKKNNRDLASYSIESKISGEMKYSYISGNTYAEYVKRALSVQKNYLNNSKIDIVIGHINKALEYEAQNMPCSAENEIAKAFPKV